MANFLFAPGCTQFVSVWLTPAILRGILDGQRSLFASVPPLGFILNCSRTPRAFSTLWSDEITKALSYGSLVFTTFDSMWGLFSPFSQG